MMSKLKLPWPIIRSADRLANLEALRILDTAAEPAYDDITSIARTITDAPVSLMSMVTKDRQWFKSKQGFFVTETGLDASVCAFALDIPMLIIPDLAQDPRTRTNPLVVERPYIRFYAGVALKLDDGPGVGTLCVIDHKPRPEGLTSKQTNALHGLARLVVMFLQVRLYLASNPAVVLPDASDRLDAIVDSLMEAYDLAQADGDDKATKLISEALVHIGVRIDQRASREAIH